ncbi:MAG: M1 family metallopeptidase [Pyrinomonadaceae bacterium]
MIFSRRVFLWVPAAIIVIGAFSTISQTQRPDFNRAHDFDVQHYTLRVSFDRAKKEVIGDTTVVLRPLNDGFRSVDLDAVDLKFRSIELEPSGRSLSYSKRGSDAISIALDRSYGPEDTISIRFKYTAKPAKGIYFVDASDRHSAQIWTQGEPDEARHWFPSFDFPSDKATTEQFITAQKGETVIGNGELVSKTDSANGNETWHFKMAVPHSTYLVSFIIGKYVRVGEKYGDLPLGYYVYPGLEKTARNGYSRTTDMLSTFEALTGIKYPFNKYDQTIVAGFEFGGMENITATTMADTEIYRADDPGFGRSAVTDLVSHELAHSWFGNMVTCRNWAELWLNEGFATFMEAVYREKAFGRGAYIAKVRSDAAQFMIDDTITRRRHGLFNRRANRVSELFDNPSVTYNKGGAVIHMLREQVGNEAFWKGVNAYLNEHKFDSVETADLKNAMERASGQDLEWFFDQWVYGTSFPRLDVRQTYSSRSKTLSLTISQTQKVEPLVSTAFRMPMQIDVETAGGTVTKILELTKRTQTITLPLDSRPKEITLDKDERVVIKSVKIRPLVTVR